MLGTMEARFIFQMAHTALELMIVCLRIVEVRDQAVPFMFLDLCHFL
jgi:hypothetical protein